MEINTKACSRQPDKNITLPLVKVLGTSIAGVAVVLTLTTAFIMYLVYDDRLTSEFQERTQAQAHEINERIVNWLQNAKNQTQLLALDNSIRVTLMLDVDYQLEERLATYTRNSHNADYFIVKQSNSAIFRAKSEHSDTSRIKHYLKLNQKQKAFFKTSDDHFYIGFQTPIIRRDQQLGIAGSVHHFHPEQFFSQLDEEFGAKLLLSETGGQLDISTRILKSITEQNNIREEVGGIALVKLDDQFGYLIRLRVYPELQYFIPRTKLDEARKEGIYTAAILSILAILCSILLASWLSRKISRPLQSLVLASQEMAQQQSGSSLLLHQSSITEVQSFSNALLKIVGTLKIAEEKVSKSHENLEAVLNNMDAIIHISDKETGEVLFVNDYGKRVFIDTDGPNYWWVYKEGQDGPHEVSTTMTLFDKNHPSHEPYEWEAKNAETNHWYEFHSQTIPWFETRRVRMEVATDITERKLAADELRLSAAVFDTAAEAVMITDRDNKIQKVNPAFCEITGYSEFEVWGKTPTILASGRHDEKFYQQMWSSLHTSGTWQGEIWNRKKSGEIYIEWLSLSAVFNKNGTLKHYVSMFSDITKRKRDEEKILYQANFDFLTGLPNRNLFLDRFSRAIEQSKRDDSSIALMFIDLDQFKYVNDTLGHVAGDQLLQEASRRLTEIMRSSDTVARLGGDEFTVLIPNVKELTLVEDIVNRILQELSKCYIIDGNDAFISASIGVTVFPDDGDDVDSLMRNADSAMYRAKDNGRNTLQYFTLEMNEQAKRRRFLETALRKAITNKQLMLHYQPILDTVSGVLRGAEALIRWNLPEHGNVYPDEFIPLAEDTGLIVPIGAWILETACEAAAHWYPSDAPAPHIAINLSSRQFQRENIVELVQNTINKTGIVPSRITLEITESILLTDDTETLDTLHQLRDMGVEIAIDDFGTGYSSLSYLKRVPVSILKIDRSFVNGLPNDPEDVALVEAILVMAQSLNLKVVAEGVETKDQHEFLRSRHCDMVQGYYFSRPVPENEFRSQSKLMAPMNSQ